MRFDIAVGSVCEVHGLLIAAEVFRNCIIVKSAKRYAVLKIRLERISTKVILYKLE